MQWGILHHPNVLRLLGAAMMERQFVIVSEWMPKGTIMEFTRANPNADRLALVGFSFDVIFFVTDKRVMGLAERRY